MGDWASGCVRVYACACASACVRAWLVGGRGVGLVVLSARVRGAGGRGYRGGVRVCVCVVALAVWVLGAAVVLVVVCVVMGVR